MVAYPRELIAHAEQQYLRHCLNKYTRWHQNIKELSQFEHRWFWIYLVVGASGALSLAIEPLRGPGVYIAWVMGAVFSSGVLLTFWLEAMACDAQARRCLPQSGGQYLEAMVTHPLTLRRLVFNWRARVMTYSQVFPLVPPALTSGLIGRTDLALWLVANGVLCIVIAKMRRRIVRRHIRARAESYLQRRAAINPNHPRPVVEPIPQPPPPLQPGGL